jgi:hypothetical protein
VHIQFCLFFCSALVYYCPEFGSPSQLACRVHEGSHPIGLWFCSSFSFIFIFCIPPVIFRTRRVSGGHARRYGDTHAHKSFLRFVPTIRCGAVPVGAAADSSHRIATAVTSNACRVASQNNGQMKCHRFAKAYGALHNFIDGPLIDGR